VEKGESRCISDDHPKGGEEIDGSHLPLGKGPSAFIMQRGKKEGRESAFPGRERGKRQNRFPIT